MPPLHLEISMPAKRIPQLDILTGATSATDDKVVIYDVTADTTKAITRQELGKGIVGDLPYTPSGGISATTIPAAIAELDTEKQPIDAGLTSIAGLATAANKMIYTTAADTYAVIDLTAAGRALLDDADAAAQRVTLGLEIGVNVQAYDADTAKLDVGQTYTAQQVMTSGLVLQSVAAADIADIANVINTANKAQGKVVYDTTNNRLMVADGSDAVDNWYVVDGSASVTPA
jgi:hypothetical protein